LLFLYLTKAILMYIIFILNLKERNIVIKEFFIPYIENDYENAFQIETLKENIFRIKILANLVISFEIILALVDIVTAYLKADNRFRFDQYLIAYLIMIIMNLTLLLFFKKYNQKMTINSHIIRKFNFIILSYITFMLCWGSVVSLLDQKLYGHLMTYMVNLIIVSVLFYLELKKYIIPYAISALILLIGLPFYQQSFDVLIGHYINLIIFSLLAFVCSRIIYFKSCEDFKNKILLETTRAELERLSYSDELTLLPNRRSYNLYIEKNYVTNLEHGITITAMMIDIDYFKQYNDNYGHFNGDTVLQSVATQLNIIVEKYGGFASRIGGEEFIYILENSNNKKAYEIAEALRKAIYNLKISHCYSTYIYLTISIGVSIMQLTGKDDIIKCIEISDKALYNAKGSGRNNTVII